MPAALRLLWRLEKRQERNIGSGLWTLDPGPKTQVLAGHIRRTADKNCQNTKLDPSPQPLDPIFRVNPHAPAARPEA